MNHPSGPLHIRWPVLRHASGTPGYQRTADSESSRRSPGAEKVRCRQDPNDRRLRVAWARAPGHPGRTCCVRTLPCLRQYLRQCPSEFSVRHVVRAAQQAFCVRRGPLRWLRGKRSGPRDPAGGVPVSNRHQSTRSRKNRPDRTGTPERPRTRRCHLGGLVAERTVPAQSPDYVPCDSGHSNSGSMPVLRPATDYIGRRSPSDRFVSAQCPRAESGPNPPCIRCRWAVASCRSSPRREQWRTCLGPERFAVAFARCAAEFSQFDSSLQPVAPAAVQRLPSSVSSVSGAPRDVALSPRVIPLASGAFRPPFPEFVVALRVVGAVRPVALRDRQRASPNPAGGSPRCGPSRARSQAGDRRRLLRRKNRRPCPADRVNRRRVLPALPETMTERPAGPAWRDHWAKAGQGPVPGGPPVSRMPERLPADAFGASSRAAGRSGLP